MSSSDCIRAVLCFVYYRAHERECEYCPVPCPNSTSCDWMLRKVGVVCHMIHTELHMRAYSRARIAKKMVRTVLSVKFSNSVCLNIFPSFFFLL